MDYKRSSDFDWNQDLEKYYVYLLRYSEIGLKGKKTRNQMELKLINNLSKSLQSVMDQITFIRERGRIHIISRSEIWENISRVMGLKSFSRVRVIKFVNKEELISKIRDVFIGRVNGKRFAVFTKRTGNHDFSSMDMDKLIGDALYNYSNGVDIKNPDVSIRLEIRNNLAFIILEDYEGPGGLPLGTEGKMVSLISGGIDSPVAIWLLLRRGSPVDMIFISLANPIDTKTFLQKAQILYSKWYSGYNPNIFIVDASRLITDYLFKGRMKYANVSYKRKMYEIADRIASNSECYGIITGESSGQVSSQTPENLYELSKNLNTVIHRPLIGMDKDWIISMARKIGTFNNDSAEEFCALFGTTPITKIRHEELEKDMENLKEYFPEENEIVKIKGSEIKEYLERIGNPEYEINSFESLPKDAIVFDVRDPISYKQWHADGSLKINPSELEKEMKNIEKSKDVVFYCTQGLQSAYMAGRARKMGYNAYFASEKIFKNQKSVDL